MIDIDWNFDLSEAPRDGRPVLIWINDHAWHSKFHAAQERWECLSYNQKPEAWAKLNAPKRAVTLPPGLKGLVK